MFRLTKRERTIIIFLLLAFVMGVGIKYWRGLQVMTPVSSSEAP